MKNLFLKITTLITLLLLLQSCIPNNEGTQNTSVKLGNYANQSNQESINSLDSIPTTGQIDTLKYISTRIELEIKNSNVAILSKFEIESGYIYEFDGTYWINTSSIYSKKTLYSHTGNWSQTSNSLVNVSLPSYSNEVLTYNYKKRLDTFDPVHTPYYYTLTADFEGKEMIFGFRGR